MIIIAIVIVCKIDYTFDVHVCILFYFMHPCSMLANACAPATWWHPPLPRLRRVAIFYSIVVISLWLNGNSVGVCRKLSIEHRRFWKYNFLIRYKNNNSLFLNKQPKFLDGELGHNVFCTACSFWNFWVTKLFSAHIFSIMNYEIFISMSKIKTAHISFSYIPFFLLRKKFLIKLLKLGSNKQNFYMGIRSASSRDTQDERYQI